MLTIPKGRPREFDLDAAVEKAMQVFWARGYEGASIAELTAAMGISRPSLYAAFGDKRRLFGIALKHYANGPRGFGAKALALPVTRDAVEALLYGVVELSTRVSGPKGCLYTHAALACGPEAEAIRDETNQLRLAGEEKLLARLQKGRDEGELPVSENLPALAKYIATVAQGITVQGAAGVPLEALNAAVEVAMRAWPRV